MPNLFLSQLERLSRVEGAGDFSCEEKSTDVDVEAENTVFERPIFPLYREEFFGKISSWAWMARLVQRRRRNARCFFIWSVGLLRCGDLALSQVFKQDVYGNENRKGGEKKQ